MRILHLFQWKLNDIIDNLNKIKEQNFDAIQITPMQKNKFNDNIPWWGYYQPVDFKIGNQLGTKADLIDLCKKANELGIIVIADVVLNHVAGDDCGNIIPHEMVNEKLVNKKEFWKSFKPIIDWNNREEVITKSIGLPTLNLRNEELQNIVINFLNEYIDCGIKGFRFDASKNIELPNEGSDFWIRVMDSISHKTIMNYAEIIYTEKSLMDEYSKYINVLSEGSLTEEDKLITFCDSHDLFLEFGVTKEMTDSIIRNEYKNIVNRFENTLFYARPYNDLWKSEDIKEINKLQCIKI